VIEEALVKRLTVVLVLATAAVASGCFDQVQTPCTPDRRLGLEILVVNGQTGAHICDATVVARDGAYSETLVGRSDARVSGCLHVGAAERSGTYSVLAEAVGFSPSTASNVRVPVSEDGCHVRTIRVEIRLAPAGD
jgi:hypothetical protein